MSKGEKLIIGSDHAGFSLKRCLVEYLTKKGYDVRDIGTDSEQSVDYPDFAVKVAVPVGSGRFERGILVCGTGLGVAICANKIAGVRAVTANTETLARLSREHNDSNVLCLGARIIDVDQAERIVDIWLQTEFAAGRHQARLDKIRQLDKKDGS